ncbi:MAG: dihydrolipoamide succinyltransferase, partial [Polyangiaceae bacterium]
MTRPPYASFLHPLSIASLLASACAPPQPPALEPSPAEPPSPASAAPTPAAVEQVPAPSADAALADASGRGVVA